jgi:hypothetical protein
MTDGPAAGIGEVMEVDFPRPRFRKEVMEHPDYYKLRAHLIEFLEVRAHLTPGGARRGGDRAAAARREEPQATATQ